MEPEAEEIESVSQALMALNDSEYDEPQIDEINLFLKSYTADYPKQSIESLFEHNSEVLIAIDTLHTFIEKYHTNLELMNELKMEMDEILYNINESPGSISI